MPSASWRNLLYGLVVIGLVAVGVLWVWKPSALRDPVGHSRAAWERFRRGRQLEAVADLYPDVMAIHRGPGGDVVVTTMVSSSRRTGSGATSATARTGGGRPHRRRHRRPAPDLARPLWRRAAGRRPRAAAPIGAADRFPDFGSEARIFESVSSATAALLGEHGESGQVAVHEVEGRSVTFFASHQVDPPGPGYRRDRDAALVLLDDRLLEIRGGRASVVALPEGIGANVLGATLLDSRNRV
jgi:hypothetical protein